MHILSSSSKPWHKQFHSWFISVWENNRLGNLVGEILKSDVQLTIKCMYFIQNPPKWIWILLKCTQLTRSFIICIFVSRFITLQWKEHFLCCSVKDKLWIYLQLHRVRFTDAFTLLYSFKHLLMLLQGSFKMWQNFSLCLWEDEWPG